ncbi:hypothetical protein, partial [Acidovorax sp.]|uniref:hypothetical protein n=1 Tax=Acidovorax sp. TaxID=1872122 RepID=UPI003BAF8D36
MAQALSDPRPEFSKVAAGLADQAAYFEGEIAFIVKTNGPIDPDVFWQLAQMLMLCNSVRIDCRIRTNELRHALADPALISRTARSWKLQLYGESRCEIPNCPSGNTRMNSKSRRPG